jgi:hypothetical protein
MGSRGFNRAALMVFSTMLWGVLEFIALQVSTLRHFFVRKR